MTDIYCRRTDENHIVPINHDDFDKLQRFKVGEVFKCKFSKPRNIQFHRKFFALLNLVFENQDYYKTEEHLLTDVKIACGYVEWLSRPGSDIVAIPRSIAFHKMDEHEFGKFFDLAIEYMIDKFIPGTDRDELLNEVEKIL